MTRVVDCSVALKWILFEEGRDAALALIGGEPLIAPDFLKLEIANVLAMKARRGMITPSGAIAGLREVSRLPGLTFRPTPPYIEAAQGLALELEQTAYDCLYLALAVAEGAVLVTADMAFGRAVAARPEYAGYVATL